MESANRISPLEPASTAERATSPRARRKRGAALIELTLLAPWFLFLFMGVVDMGFYWYDLIAVENATRVAAEYTSQGTATAADATTACTLVLADMAAVTNVAGLTSCGSAPLVVTATSVTGPDSKTATSVTVTYTTPTLFTIPGLLANQFTISRNIEMRVQ